MKRFVAATVIALAAAACHKQQQLGELNLSPKVSIVVVNNYTPADQMQVFMVNQNGGKQLLGTVSPGRTAKFSYTPTSAVDKFTLVAQTTSGRSIPSQIFTLVNAESITWDLRSNTMQIFEP